MNAGAAGLVAVWLAAAVLVAGDANATTRREFSKDEWRAMPAYCRAKHSWSYPGRWFSGTVPLKEVDRWASTLGGGDNWDSIHHYCWGLLDLRDAKRAATQGRRDFFLRAAIGEALFVFNKTTHDGYLYAEIGVHVAYCYMLLGEHDNALRYLNLILTRRPEYPKAYSLSALIYRKAGRNEEALEILAKGIRSSSVADAELHYIYGTIAAEMSDFETALTQAKKAYALGYPLPGLKRKLKRLGHWRD